jgi:DNA-directed RNA polymerase subunit RPC12/RpoP
MEVSGAYAVIVHDTETQAVYFAKNTERPLYMAETFDRVFIMSEREALEFFLRRNNYTSQIVKLVNSDTLFKFDLITYKITEEGDLKKAVASFPYYGSRGSYWENDHEANPYQHIQTSHVKSYPINKKTVKFMVTGIVEESKVEYLYTGETTDDQPIEFRTNENHPELIAKMGESEVAYEITRGGKKTLFIKFRSIKWDDDEVTTLNGNKMSRGKWKAVTTLEQCGECNGNVDEPDFASTVVDQKGVVCKHCVSKRLVNVEG